MTGRAGNHAADAFDRCPAMLGNLQCELAAGHDGNHLAHADNPLGEEIVEWFP